jgi:hypothetical protein
MSLTEQIKLEVDKRIEHRLGVKTGTSFVPMLGKFEAHITDNNDPARLGRVRAKLTKNGMDTVWAKPNIPSIDELKMPPIGTGVWIEFAEGGNPMKPVWTGCFFENNPFGASNAPSISHKQKVWQSNGGKQYFLMDEQDNSIGMYNDIAGSYVKYKGDGGKDEFVKTNVRTEVKAKKQDRIVGSWVRTVGNELVTSIVNACKTVIGGLTSIVYGAEIYVKFPNENDSETEPHNFMYVSGGKDKKTGVYYSMSDEGVKFELGENEKASESSREKIKTAHIEGEIVLVSQSGAQKIDMTIFESVTLLVDKQNKKVAIEAFEQKLEFDGNNKTFLFQDNGSTKSKVESSSTGLVVQYGDNQKVSFSSSATEVIHSSSCKMKMDSQAVNINDGKLYVPV